MTIVFVEILIIHLRDLLLSVVFVEIFKTLERIATHHKLCVRELNLYDCVRWQIPGGTK